MRILSLSAALALLGCAAAGCASIEAANASDEHPTGSAQSSASTTVTNPSGDPGCIAALKAISTYGPSTVKLLAEGREAVNNAGVHLLVTALDGAADAADQPAIKQDIRTLATAYDDYFDLTNDVVSVPVSVVLKDTIDLEGLCRG